MCCSGIQTTWIWFNVPVGWNRLEDCAAKPAQRDLSGFTALVRLLQRWIEVVTSCIQRRLVGFIFGGWMHLQTLRCISEMLLLCGARGCRWWGGCREGTCPPLLSCVLVLNCGRSHLDSSTERALGFYTWSQVDPEGLEAPVQWIPSAITWRIWKTAVAVALCTWHVDTQCFCVGEKNGNGS